VSAADRMRVLRKRRKHHEVVAPVPTDVDEIEDLVEAGFLHPEHAEDRREIGLAWKRLHDVVRRKST
jgi:hypothetical protein